MNAMTQSALLASTNLSAVDLDAELIRMCDAHAAKIDAANALVEDDDDQPDQVAYDRSYEFICNTKATTVAGVIAKARAAKAEAVRARISGEECWEGGPAETWAQDIANELLELGGSPVLASPDAELIRLSEQFIIVEQTILAEPCEEEPGTPEAAETSRRICEMANGQFDLAVRMDAIGATTEAGVAAVARCLAVHNEDGAFGTDDPNTTAGRLLDQLMRNGAALAQPVSASSNPDPALIALCQRGLALDAEQRRLWEPCANMVSPQGTPEQAALDAYDAGYDAEWEDIKGEICGTRATTPEGRYAKAQFFLKAMNGGEDDVSQSLLIDINVEAERLGLKQGSVVDAFPDADLLDAVAAFFAARASRPTSTGAEKIAGTPECERYEASLEAYFAAEADLFRTAMAMPARTMLGIRGKARLVQAWEEHGDHVDALLKDIANWSAAA